METKLAAIFAGPLQSVSVTALCAELGISRPTFYKYQKRWQTQGPEGLLERSRAPHRSPQMMSAATEDEIVRLRKALPLDKGAQTIQYRLQRTGWDPVPSVSAIHRALVRRGQVVAQPHKRPKSALRRFVWPMPNSAWQIDATQWALRDGAKVWVMDVLDDHSRLLVASRARSGPTGEAAWDAFCHGVSHWGLPARVMSDNGPCFTARFISDLREAAFERDLRRLGITHILSSPGHPQCCGKIERQHYTLKCWLATKDPAKDIDDLQDRLDDYQDFYNNDRPHRALRGATPLEVWSGGQKDWPGPAIPADTHAGLRTVNRDGKINWSRTIIGIGMDRSGEKVVVIDRGDDLAIFGRDGLIRRLTVDRTRTYQPSGRATGRPKQSPSIVSDVPTHL